MKKGNTELHAETRSSRRESKSSSSAPSAPPREKKVGWQTKTLSDVCNITSALVDPRMTKYEKMLHVGGANIESKTGELIDLKTSKEEGLQSGKFAFDDSMVLYSKIRPYLMKVARPDFQGVCSADIYPLSPNPSVLDRSYLYHQLLSPQFTEFAVSGSARAGMPKVNRDHLFAFQISFPPLPEQQRIVGLLDEAFAGLATAKANAEKNLQNARALFESHLQSVFTQRGPGWVDRTLDQVCIVERGSSPRPIKDFFTTKPDGVNWIKIGDTEEGGKYVYSTGQKITPEGAMQSRFVKEGDFILTNSMSYGRPYIMKTSGCIHDGWFVLRLNTAIDTDYFYYLLSSPVVQLQFASLASGSVVKNISGDLVKKAVLPIPPLKHQHIIVEKLLAMSKETQRLAHLYEKKLAALEALKKSLLHQAFAGEL